jgi:broad specificity phosphatase PhoE
MKPKRIFIIRHGESEGNTDRHVYEKIPDWKIPLTQLGAEQAQLAGKNLVEKLSKNRVDYQGGAKVGVYYSPFLRTVQTWRNMAVNIPGDMIAFEKEDARLREQERGNMRPFDEIDSVEAIRDEYGTFFYRFRDGESGADVYDRSTDFLATLYRDFEKEDFPENVLIVSHAFTMRVLLKRWLHWTVDEFHTYARPDNCFVAQLEYDGKHFKLLTEMPRKK